MKIFTKLFIALAFIGLSAGANAQDFSAVNNDGVTIYYNITSAVAPMTAAVARNYSYTGNIVIPSSVTYGENVYAVTSIGGYAFVSCSGLTSVTIPNSVTLIGEKAFYGCSGLTAINVDVDNASFCSEDGILFNKSKTTLRQCPAGKTGALTIPNSVTSIGSYAFYGCRGLTSLTIPNSITSIGSYAFYGFIGLTDVAIPNSVTSIGNYAFAFCSGLTGILAIPNSVTLIGQGAFCDCSGLTSLAIPNSVTLIHGYAFENCRGLTDVYVYWETPIFIYENVFGGVNISTVKLHIPQGTKPTYQNAPVVWQEFILLDDIIAGIETITNDDLRMTIYPNPVKDVLFIMNNEQLIMNNVEVVDLTGRTLISQSFHLSQINVSQLSAGVYFVKIGNFTGKFVKE